MLTSNFFAWIYKNLNIRIELKNMQYDVEVLKNMGMRQAKQILLFQNKIVPLLTL
jgi:hypothetical protein